MILAKPVRGNISMEEITQLYDYADFDSVETKKSKKKGRPHDNLEVVDTNCWSDAELNDANINGDWEDYDWHSHSITSLFNSWVEVDFLHDHDDLESQHDEK